MLHSGDAHDTKIHADCSLAVYCRNPIQLTHLQDNVVMERKYHTGLAVNNSTRLTCEGHLLHIGQLYFNETTGFT